MKYFPHDTAAFADEKVTELFIAFGYEGVGLFYAILERLAYQEKPIKTEVLKHQLKVGKKLEKTWKFLEEIELISTKNGETFNKRLTKFIETYAEKSEKTKKRVSQHRENKALAKNVTRYEQECTSYIENINTNVFIKEEREEEKETREAPPPSSPPFGKVVMTSDSNFVERICDESESEFQNLCKKNGLLGDFNRAADDFYKTQKALDKTWADFRDFKRHFWNVVLKNIGKSPPRETPDERMQRERRESGRTLKVNFVGSKKVE